MDYEKEVIDSVKQEFDGYKKEELSKPVEEIFENSYQNHFYKEMFDYFVNENEENDDTSHIRALHSERGLILSQLFDYYIKSEFASISNYGEMRELICDYVDKYHEDEMD